MSVTRIVRQLWVLLNVIVASAVATAAEPPAPYVLSDTGSGRATAYPPTNKIVTLGERTHVTWLDSDANGFWNRIRTLDRQTGQWSPVWTLGAAQDNHGGAALTVDNEGYLHAAYYPHHEAMRYRRSLRPNDASAWTAEETFGENLTYPVLLSAADGSLFLTARRSYHSHDGFTPPPGSPPWESELWRRPRDGEWRPVGPLLRGRFSGYVQFAEAFWWGNDHRTLHMSCRIYETDYPSGSVLWNTVGYLVSRDGGVHWERADGTPVTLPATPETIDVIARGGSTTADVLTSGGLIVGADGRPLVLYGRVSTTGGAVTYLAKPNEDGAWTSRNLSALLPAEARDWELVLPGAITRSQGGRIVVAGTLQQVPPGESGWAHPSNEVGQLWSDDEARTFHFERFGPPDPHRPRWLPNLERATGHHLVPERPSLIYTDGEAGRGNTGIVQNGVIWRAAGQ